MTLCVWKMFIQMHLFLEYLVRSSMSWVGAESQEYINKVALKQVFRTFASTISTPLRAEVINLYWGMDPLPAWLMDQRLSEYCLSIRQ